MAKKSVSDASVHIDGLARLRKDLKAAGKDIDTELKRINVEMATTIISQARGNARGRMESKSAGNLKPMKSAVQGGVNLRATTGVPYALGAEFGAKQNAVRHRSTGEYHGYNQFQPWTGANTGSGHFLWPAIRQIDVLGEYTELLDNVVRDLGE